MLANLSTEKQERIKGDPYEDFETIANVLLQDLKAHGNAASGIRHILQISLRGKRHTIGRERWNLFGVPSNQHHKRSITSREEPPK